MQNRITLLLLAAFNLFISAGSASAKLFQLAGGPVDLQEVTPVVEVYYRSMRFNRANDQWNFDLTLRNTAVAPLIGPVMVLVDVTTNTSGAIAPDGHDDQGKAWYDCSGLLPVGGLVTGSESAPRTLALGAAAGVPQITLRVFAAGSAAGTPLAFVRTLNEFGQPLPAVEITANGPAGNETNSTDSSFGVATVGVGPGTNAFEFQAGGYLPVWRQQILTPGTVIEIPSPRLARRGTNAVSFGAAGAMLTNQVDNFRITIPAGAFNGNTTALLTPATAQTLPSRLPAGWSPLQAFWLELTTEPTAPLVCQLDLWQLVGTNEKAALVRWNPASLQWDVVNLVDGLGSAAISVSLSGSGAWAVVVRDSGTNALPPAPRIGQPLQGAIAASPDFSQLRVSGMVAPQTSTPSRQPELVTAMASLTVSNIGGSLTSGALLRARVTENYRMRDGTTRITPSYETWFSGYQRPGSTNSSVLQASLPLRPLLLLGGEELLLGTVTVDILPPTSFAGAVFNSSGGLAEDGSVRISAVAGSVDRPQALQITGLEVTNFSSLAGDGITLLTAFQLTIGRLAPSAQLELQVTNAPANGLFVLARVLSESGVYGLQPIARLSSDGNGKLASAEPSANPTLPGFRESGQYVLVQVAAAQSLVTGIARNSRAQPIGGLIVRLGPWTTLSADDGSYRLLAAAGNSSLGLADVLTGDTTVKPITVAPNQPVVNVDLSITADGPRVLSVLPANQSTNVPLVASINLSFSKPLNPGTVTGSALQLIEAGTNAVPANISLNLRNDELTLLPVNPLDPQMTYTIALSTNIADVGGLRLSGPSQFSFATAAASFTRDVAAQLIVYEATNGVVWMRGSPGFSQPGQPVVLVNEVSGRTTTVLAAPDGSFAGPMQAGADDQLSVTVVNGNGSRDSITPARKIYSDGGIGLFHSGGTISVSAENGQIDFVIEPGAIASQTKLKLEPVPLTNVLTLISNTQPESGRVLGGFKFSAIQGSPLSQRIEVSFPVKLADLQLPPGIDPTNCAYGLAIARVVDGQQVFELVDRMHFENGRLVTHSPPFFGLLGPFEDILVMPLLLFTGSTGLAVNGKVYAVQVDTGTGKPAPGAPKEYLVNALVSGHPASSAGQLQGRLRPGSVFTSSGPKGSYTLLLSVNPADPSRTVAVTASHPRFPGVNPATALPNLDPAQRLAIGDALLGTDVYFPLRAFAQRAPPVIAVSQAPEQPAVGTNVTLTIVSTDNDSMPSIDVAIDSIVSLIPGVQAVSADVSVGFVSSENPGPRARRDTYLVTSTKAAQVELLIQSIDTDGNKAQQLYPLLFGAVTPPVTNDIPVADPSDHSGPYVVVSEPSSGSSGLAPGDGIVLQFNKPISQQVLSQVSLLSLDPPAGPPQLVLSRDQRFLTVSYPLLIPGSNYTFSIHNIKDLSGNLLDQDPTSPGAQGFSLSFTMAPMLSGRLVDTGVASPETISAAGSIIRGNYAYVIERRASASGRLAVYDLSNPAAPTLAGAYDCPAFPRDLVLLPQYSFAWTNAAFKNLPPTVGMFTNILKKDLIGIVGGLAGAGQLQWMRIVDISDPVTPKRLAGAVVGASSGMTLPIRIKWSPPTLAYLEAGQPSTVSLVNLQEFLIGEVLVANQAEYVQLPEHGRPGLDLNDDGDYVDPGEVLPLPAKYPIDLAGKDALFGVFDTDQAINDFALANGGMYVGAVLDSGYLMGTNGLGIHDAAHAVLPAYRSLFSAGLQLSRTNASYSFSMGVPRRVASLFQYPLIVSNQILRLDLAVVGVRGTGSNWVSVLDVTDRLGIKLLTEVNLPVLNGSTNIYSLERRDDGLLVVASDAHSFLIDPAKFNTPTTNGTHPALVGILPGLGGGANTFDSTEVGLHVTAGPDGKATVLQTAPKMRFVAFPAVAPFSPAGLVGKSDSELADRVAKASPQDFLLPSRFRGLNDCAVGTITNLDPTTHYYVLIETPGGAGPTLDLALESLNRSGSPLRKRGFLFPPVHAFSVSTLQNLLQTPSNDDAPVRACRAWRLSNDPSSKFFNFYLSRPIVLVAEEMSKDALAGIDAQLERDVLWSGSSLRASFDPGAGTNSPLALFAGHVDGADREYKPGVEAVASAFPADYLQSPNPGPIAGAMSLPLAFNTLAPHSSEIMHEAMDLQLAGRRLGIHFKRSYSGQGLFSGPFGRGWDFSYNQRITELDRAVPPGACLPQVLRASTQDSEVAANRDLLFYTGGGRVVTFKYSGSVPPPEIANDPLVQELGWLSKSASFYLPPPGLFVPMFKFKDGTYARLEPDGTQYWYDSLGRLVRIYDRFEQNSLELTYNRRGDLIRIDDELGRPLDIGYYRVASDPTFRPDVDISTTNPGDLGKIARLKDYSRRDVQYQYSDDGLLDRRLGPRVDSVALPESFTGRQLTRYLYSDSSDPQRSGKSLIGVTGDDSSGAPFLAATELGKKGRDTVSKLLIGGKPLTIQQDHANTALGLSQNGGKITVTQADNSKSAFQMDYLGRVTNSVYSGANAPTLTTSSEYYTNGLLKAVTYPEGNRIEYYYDEGSPSLRSRGNLFRVRRLPGPRGGAILEATSQFDSWYNLPSGPKTDLNGNIATITLRSDHKDTEFVDSSGGREEFRDNDFGQMVYFKTIDGVVQQWQYNQDTGFLDWTSVGDDQVHYSYVPKTAGSSAPEQLGYATALLTPNNVTKNNTYDERGKLIREERAGLLIERAFDASGRLIKTVSTVDQGKQITQEWAYNQLGFLLTNTIRNVELGAQAQDLITTFIPDDLNRVKEAFFPAGDHHLLSYDHLGRVTSYVVEGVYGETYSYDANGNLTNRFNGVGRQSFGYDGHDRLIRTTLPNGTAIQQQLDGNGNILARAATDAQSQLLYYSTNSFDAQNRPLVNALQGDAGMSLSANTYDSINHRLIVRDALGATLTNWFDSSGRLAGSAGPTVIVTNTFDGENNLRFRTTQLESGSFQEEFQYDALSYATNHLDALGNPEGSAVGFDGRVLKLRDKEGQVVINTYSVLGEKLSESDPNGVKIDFAYDINRKLATVSDTRGQSTQNSFDFAGRLTAVALPDAAVNSYTNFTPLTAPANVTLPRNISVSLKYDFMGNVTNRLIVGPGGVRPETYSYDGLQRAKRIEDPNGFVEFDYDLLGPWKQIRQGYIFLSNPPAPAQLQFSLQTILDAGGFRSSLVLPFNRQTNFYVRDLSGRLLALTNLGSEPVVRSTSYAGPDVMRSRTLGNNRVQLDVSYDGNQRAISRRYRRISDGLVLADIRYAYDRNAVIVVRQDVHRGGRSDLFAFDPGYRLRRADYDAHPSLGAGQKARTMPGFSTPVQLQGQWVAGSYARKMDYNEVDLMTAISAVNPDGLELPAVAGSFSDGDALLFQQTIDGFVRARDEVGNITRTRLLVRPPGQIAPTLVAANLTYDELGRLARVERDDGVTVLNEYDAQGNRIRRSVSGDPTKCVPSDVAFIYDGRTLLEERDLSHNGALLAQFYYIDGAPVAADADYSASGTLKRYYFLTDQLGSVRAITDATGTVLERVNYEAWGQPLIQSADVKVPRISRVIRDGSDLVLVFSEAVLPPLADDSSVTNLLPTLKDLGSLVTADQAGTAIAGTVVLEETFPGMPFGTCVRFKPTGSLAGSINLHLSAGALVDEWGNPIPAETLTVNAGQAGNILYTGPDLGSSAPTILGRSAFGFSLLMHGQVFDFDTGLLYCQSRYYDPYTTSFLQRDPEGYADSVNQYAAFAHNPVNMTDRSGTAAADYADSVRKFGERAADRFGFPGRIVNTVAKGVGWLLELGTEASQGWDLLESDRQGSFGLIDRMQGAQILIDEGNKVLVAGMLLHAAGGMIASKAQGYLAAAAHREIDGARRASRELFTYHEESRCYSEAIEDLKRMGGFHEIESEAAVYASENTGVAAHGRYNEKKAQVRYARVSEGFEGKPGYLGVKVDEGTGLAEHTITGGPVRYGIDNETGKIVEIPKYSKTRQFTSDIDFYALTKGDRLATAKEIAEWDNAFRSKFEQLKLERGMPHLQFPKRHPSQLELAESFGRMSGGKKVNNKLLKKVGEVTANSTVLTISPNGTVSKAQDAYLNGLLDQAEVRLKQLQRRYGEEPVGFIGPWRHGVKAQ